MESFAKPTGRSVVKSLCRTTFLWGNGRLGTGFMLATIMPFHLALFAGVYVSWGANPYSLDPDGVDPQRRQHH